VVLQFAFETLRLHRIEVAIIPRNMASRRVMEKLGMRTEGVALGYLEINGEWEDHVRYAMTAEEWRVRGPELKSTWLKRN
jgi:ribosomal-protein-alanine N-acetyltransferase